MVIYSERYARQLLFYCVALLPFASVFGFMPDISPLYYIELVGIAAWSLMQRGRVSKGAILLLCACCLSIIYGAPHPLFKSWPRLALFTILIIAVFPLVDNVKLSRFRYRLLLSSLLICVFIGVTGFFCYLLGINLMVKQDETMYALTQHPGTFGGLTNHSMLLGPCSAFGAITCLWFWWRSQVKKRKYILLGCMALCILSVFLSGSRHALIALLVGVAVFVFIINRGNIAKFIGYALIIASVAIVTYPLYRPYLLPILLKQEMNEKGGGSFYSRESRWDMRVKEIEEHPVFGVGFAAMDVSARDQYNRKTGVVEPGSSYMALLSMTGLVGASIFGVMFLSTIIKLVRYTVRGGKSSKVVLIIPILAAFTVSLVVEGYIFAGGSFLCYLFWLVFGVGYSMCHNYVNRSLA